MTEDRGRGYGDPPSEGPEEEGAEMRDDENRGQETPGQSAQDPVDPDGAVGQRDAAGSAGPGGPGSGSAGPQGLMDDDGFSFKSLNRRDWLKGLAGLPFVGWIFWKALEKRSREAYRRGQIISELGELHDAPAILPSVRHATGDKIRLGVIGYGGEGEWLVRCAGFAHPSVTEDWTEARRRDPGHTALRDFLNQTDLNVEITAVCDVYDVRAERALAAAANQVRPGAGSPPGARRYHHYQDLLRADDVDAVIIATPDHWHARMAIDAANEGKHVYLEKAMTRTEQEARDLHDAVKRTGIVFQLGHQNRQLESHEKARQIVQKDLLGPVNLVETTTNRNSPGGAWVYDIPEEAGPHNIDWALFQEAAPSDARFSLERFFRWRCWFDYGTGLSGDLFSHEYDSVNQVLQMGIPETVMASGGIYFYRTDTFHDHWDPERFPLTEERDVPDTFQVACEYPQRQLTLLYSATLSNGRNRGMHFMGHDASMEVSASLQVQADWNSTRYRDLIRSGVIDTSIPMFTWMQGSDRIDALTSASDRYFLSRGLMYTYRDGRLLPTNHLHIAEWLDVIRNGGTTSCNIDRGFEEAMTCHMATRSYREGRRVRWDPRQRRIV